jgi:hypothetical protein
MLKKGRIVVVFFSTTAPDGKAYQVVVGISLQKGQQSISITTIVDNHSSRKQGVMNKDPANIDSPNSRKGQFLVYEAQDGRVKIDVRLEDETVWLTQQLMADLFQTSQQNISLHIQNVYEERKLVPKATHKKYLSVRREGQPF